MIQKLLNTTKTVNLTFCDPWDLKRIKKSVHPHEYVQKPRIEKVENNKCAGKKVGKVQFVNEAEKIVDLEQKHCERIRNFK